MHESFFVEKKTFRHQICNFCINFYNHCAKSGKYGQFCYIICDVLFIVIPESYLLNEQEEKEMLSNYSTIVAQIISRCMPNLKITTRWAPQQIIT